MLATRIENAKICLRINYTSGTFNGLDAIFDSFSTNAKKNIHIDLQRVWQTYDEEGTPLGEEAIIFSNKCLDNGFNLLNPYVDSSKGCPCYADKIHFAHINFDGKIYKCTARNYEEINELGYIDENGIIQWDPKKLMPPHRKLSFENKTCINCKFLPVCLGPYFQKRYENRSHSSFCFINSYKVFFPEYIKLKYKQKFNNHKVENSPLL